MGEDAATQADKPKRTRGKSSKASPPSTHAYVRETARCNISRLTTELYVTAHGLREKLIRRVLIPFKETVVMSKVHLEALRLSELL